LCQFESCTNGIAFANAGLPDQPTGSFRVGRDLLFDFSVGVVD